MVETRLDELRGEIAEGLREARRGELIPGDEVFARIQQRSHERDG